MRTLLVIFALITVAITPPFVAAQKIDLTVDVSKAGAKMDRNIFGQFAEHLGRGVYEGEGPTCAQFAPGESVENHECCAARCGEHTGTTDQPVFHVILLLHILQTLLP